MIFSKKLKIFVRAGVVVLAAGMGLGTEPAYGQDTLRPSLVVRERSLQSNSVAQEVVIYVDGQRQTKQYLTTINPDDIYNTLIFRSDYNVKLFAKLFPEIKDPAGALIIVTEPNKDKPATIAFTKQVIRLATHLSFGASLGMMKLVSQALPDARYYLDSLLVTQREAAHAKGLKGMIVLKGPPAADYAHDLAAATTGVIQLETK